jgi:GNAT superfamily N-acetyltransferase
MLPLQNALGADAFRGVASKIKITNMKAFGISLTPDSDRPYVFVKLETDAGVVGYCYVQEYEDTGYVRNIVVAPAERGRGVGRGLMRFIARRLRDSGKTYWRLNVKPDNHAALALYDHMGLRFHYRATALRLPWAVLGSLPASAARGRPLASARDGTLEERFDLPRGQLRHARGLGRLVLEAVLGAEETPVGLAVFDPNFPGAFPFRVVDTAVVGALLGTIRAHVPSHEFLYLMAEGDPRLTAMLTGVGATVRDEILHLKGSIPVD